jgi:hypothetical protein
MVVKSFMKQVHTDRKQVRWMSYLQQYNFDIIHKPGKHNTNADGASRREYPDSETTTDPTELFTLNNDKIQVKMR